MKKDNGLTDALANIMGGTTEVQETSARPTKDPQRTPKRPTTEVQQASAARDPVKVRFDAGDYARLQEIARQEGTTAAAIVRKITKEYLRGKS